MYLCKAHLQEPIQWADSKFDWINDESDCPVLISPITYPIHEKLIEARFLNNNRFNGSIPSTMANLQNLTKLYSAILSETCETNPK
jgi:hypothetical protein